MSQKTSFLGDVHVKSLTFDRITPSRSATSGQWLSYVPAITASVDPVLPVNALVTHQARYCILGNTLFLRYTFSNASAFFGTSGTGPYSISLPTGCVARQIFDSEAIGSAYGSSGGTAFTGTATLESPFDVSVRSGTNTWGSTFAPFSAVTLMTFHATIELISFE